MYKKTISLFKSSQTTTQIQSPFAFYSFPHSVFNLLMPRLSLCPPFQTPSSWPKASEALYFLKLIFLQKRGKLLKVNF